MAAKIKLTAEQQKLADIKSFAQRLRRSGITELRVEYEWRRHLVNGELPADVAVEMSNTCSVGSRTSQHRDEQRMSIMDGISSHCNQDERRQIIPGGLISVDDFISNCLSLVAAPVIFCDGTITVETDTGLVSLTRQDHAVQSIATRTHAF